MQSFDRREGIYLGSGLSHLVRSRGISKAVDRWIEMNFISSLQTLAEKMLRFGLPLVGFKLDPSRDIALVTGGAGGLGWELVRELQRKRIVTVVLDIVPPSGLRCLNDIYFYSCDISIPGRIREIHEQIITDVGHVTILINNAAITSDAPLEAMENEQIEKIMQVNLLGPYMLIREFLPSMLSIGRGYIVNIASVLGFVTPARLTAYGASKGGLIALHESLVDELDQFTWINMNNSAYLPSLSSRGSIRSLLVCPGKIDTKMFDNAQSPSKIIAPDLDPKCLAREIIKAIDHNRSGTLKLPYYTNLMTYFKSLDWPWFRLFRLCSGFDSIITERRETNTTMGSNISSRH
ncbi:short-chain dehydrogenase/reductase Ecym_3361 [Eremothecium cymbalariae DBVPG|uniref:Uncharacterized protein n=1 Tax=Eremothecium cymbalariae (strain CBS 270.75 / DBVPG 7215 / KCTC 17166 / NRRL Y-17582) TaxID=931890 RepID=G8JRS9_ERECY|nr:Hypothetical protein Ecym_3361 [Eremothecium cymbalariae DBVPG\